MISQRWKDEHEGGWGWEVPVQAAPLLLKSPDAFELPPVDEEFEEEIAEGLTASEQHEDLAAADEEGFSRVEGKTPQEPEEEKLIRSVQGSGGHSAAGKDESSNQKKATRVTTAQRFDG